MDGGGRSRRIQNSIRRTAKSSGRRGRGQPHRSALQRFWPSAAAGKRCAGTASFFFRGKALRPCFNLIKPHRQNPRYNHPAYIRGNVPQKIIQGCFAKKYNASRA
jgi:hypothetical protein